jgi:thymidylate kinase
MTLCHIFGIDGSGKTTFARTCVEELQRQGHAAAYVYAQHEPRLLAPIKWLARRTVIRHADPAADYAGYSRQKKATSSQHPALGRLYALLWILDYVVATQVRLAGPRLRRVPLVVVDRYYPDVAVNIAQAIGLDAAGQARLMRLFGRLLPKASISVWLDVPEAVAFARKNDIPAEQYLTERRTRYLSVADVLGAVRIDGTLPAAEVVGRGVALINQTVASIDQATPSAA